MQYDDGVLRKLQLAELEVLRAIARVCRDHGIQYFLDSGTCLGAVRHGGFIPWDDDIDLGMMRSEYERFLEIAPEALGEDYVVSDPCSCKNHAGMFAKVWKRDTKFFTEETIDAGIPQGIFVDIFPYDTLHADPAITKKQRRMCRLWQSVSYLFHSRHITVPHGGILGACEKGVCGVAHACVGAFLSHDRIVASFLKWAKRGIDSPGDYVLNLSYGVTEDFLQEWLLPTGEVLFEGIAFSSPGNTESYLVAAYGSTWRELPPLEARRNHAPVELDFGEPQELVSAKVQKESVLEEFDFEEEGFCAN